MFCGRFLIIMREAAQNACFEGKVEMPRIRHGFKQTLETLINEEALLLAKYLRGERKTWVPRIPKFY